MLAKIRQIFINFVTKFPGPFLSLLGLLVIEAFLAFSSVVFLVPLADYLLDPELEKPNKITIFTTNLFEYFSLDISLYNFATIFVLSNFAKAGIEILVRKRTLEIKYTVYKSYLMELLHEFFHAKIDFFETKKQGKLLNTFQKEINNVSDTMGHVATQLSFCIQLLVYLALPLYLSPGMAISAFILALLFAVPFFIFHKLGYRLGQKNTETANELTSCQAETISSARAILSHAAIKQTLKINQKSVDEHIDASIKSQTFIASIGFIFQPFAILAALVSISIGLSTGETITTVATVLWSLMKALPIISKMLQTNMNIANFLPSYEQIQKLLNEAIQFREINGNIKFSKLTQAIHFEKVTFSHYLGSQLFANLNFKIPAGSITAIVGPSGSGKSSIVDLLLGLKSPEKGSILFDEQNLEYLNKHYFRKRVGYVAQDTILFNLSIKENLLWVKPTASDAEIKIACKMAGIDKFIESLPHGLNTMIAERGASLSGGQRQKLSFARALLLKPQILILDEATSSLDIKSIQHFKSTILKLAPEITIILITHQKTMMEMADKAILIDNGVIIDQLTPNQISDKYPSYIGNNAT